MKSAKKLLAFFMAVIMLFSVMSVGMVAMAATVSVDSNTGADNYETTDNVIICVPETIYLKPSDAENGSTTAQYFVNNKVDETGKISVAAKADDTRGEISIYAPEFTAFSISANAVSGDIGDPIIGSSNDAVAESYENVRWENSSFGGKGYIYFAGLCCYINGKGLKFGQTALVEWEVTLYYGDDDTVGKTYYAYTALYSPLYNAVGASTETRYDKSNRYNQNTSWIVGLTGISTVETSVGGSGMNNDVGSLVSGSFINEPLLGLSTNVVKSSVANVKDTINENGAKYVRGYQLTNNTSTSSRGSIGYISVDSSRYTNMNQVPNFHIGSECNEAGSNNASLLHLYSLFTVGALNCYTADAKNESTPSGWTFWAKLTENNYEASKNVKCSVESGITSSKSLRDYVYDKHAVRFYYAPSIELSSITSEDYLHVMTQTKAESGATDFYANTYVSAQINVTDKSDLRASVIQSTSLDETKYTQNSWSGASATVVEEFQDALRDAAEVLGNPAASQSEIDSALSNLENKKSKLKVTIHFNAATNGGAFEDGDTYKDYNVTFGAKNSVTLGSALLKYFKVLKKDYEFIGWTVYPENDPLKASLDSIANITYGDTLIAHFRKTIAVNFHYLVDVSGNTDVTENSPYIIYDNEDKALNVDVKDPDKVSDYEFTGWTLNPKSTKGETLADKLEGVTESTEYYATYQKNIKVRLDSNGGTFDITSVFGGIGYNYDLTQSTGTTTTVTLPETTPTKAGSSFKGWDIDGVVYQAGDTVEISESTTATAVWDVGVYKVTFVYMNTNGTELSVDENIEYGNAAIAPTEFPQCWYNSEKHYKFVKWDKEFDFISDDTVIKAVYTTGENHNYTTEGKYPTCDEAGEVKFTCNDCGYSYVYSSGPLGCDFESVDSKDATCTEDGYVKYVCKNDPSHTKTEVIKAQGHKYEGTDYVPPTCTEEGYYKSGECSNCHQDLTNIKIKALGHDFSIELEHENATCTEGGYTLYKCSRCDETDTVTIPAHDHDWTAVVTPATCEKDGKTVYTCSYDPSHTQTLVIPAIKHNWITIVIAPTCTSKGYTIVSCANCGESSKKDYVDALGHDYSSVEVPPTCTEKGYTKYTCSACGHSYKDNFVDAVGHDHSKITVVAPTCTKRGYTLYECTNCDSSYKSDFVDAIGHDYELINTVQPTLTQSGYKHYKCSTCGNEYKKIIYSEGKALVAHTLYDDNNDIVADAIITVVHNESGETIILKSDKNGYFTYVFPEGSYTLTVSAYGYDTITGTLTVKNGEYEIQTPAVPKYKCSCLCHVDSFIGRLYRFITKLLSLFGYKCCECSQTN